MAIQILKVHICPNAKKEEILGLYNNEYLKISVMAQPIDGKANKALINLLAKKLHIAKSNITIVKGENSRDKILNIDMNETIDFKNLI